MNTIHASFTLRTTPQYLYNVNKFSKNIAALTWSFPNSRRRCQYSFLLRT